MSGCAICQEARPKLQRRLSCGHAFCWSCIDTWLLVQPTCPLCRVHVGATLQWPSQCLVCGQCRGLDPHDDLDHTITVQFQPMNDPTAAMDTSVS